jgi:hypothetical protein
VRKRKFYEAPGDANTGSYPAERLHTEVFAVHVHRLGEEHLVKTCQESLSA